MNLIYAGAIACAFGCGIYLLLSRHALRIVFGIMLISASVNFGLFFAGRIGPFPPPVMRVSETVLEAGAANPLPQALVLTAIVIGFCLIAFLAALVLRISQTRRNLDMQEFADADQLGDPQIRTRSE